jgi:hypothetical protein
MDLNIHGHKYSLRACPTTYGLFLGNIFCETD